MPIPPCPNCDSAYAYIDANMFVCPECGHEWSQDGNDDESQVKDSVGNPLADGDSVTVIKDLKIKGSSSVVKVGTKIKNIRLVNPDANAGHDIDCKVDGIGALKVRSMYVKKA